MTFGSRFMEQKITGIVAGDSHTLCLAPFNNHFEENHDILYGDDSILLSRVRPSDRRSKFDGSYWDLIYGKINNKAAIISWKGNQHIVGAIFNSGAQFDFLLPGESNDNLDENVTIIPISVVKKWFLNSVAGLSKVIHGMMDSGATKVIVLGTPPPKGNDLELIGKLKRSPRFIEAANRVGVHLESKDALTPIEQRVKLWRFLQILYGDIAKESGATFLSHPSGSESENGSLKPEFDNGDITHDNGKYGELMLEKLVNHLKDK
jgi:hypothetical protein